MYLLSVVSSCNNSIITAGNQTLLNTFNLTTYDQQHAFCEKAFPCDKTKLPVPDLSLEVFVVGGFKVWHILFIVIAIIIASLVMYCCLHRVRIPRTKQEIEMDLLRTNLTNKFRLHLQNLPAETATFTEALKKVQELNEKLEQEQLDSQGVRKRIGWLKLKGKDQQQRQQDDDATDLNQTTDTKVVNTFEGSLSEDLRQLKENLELNVEKKLSKQFNEMTADELRAKLNEVPQETDSIKELRVKLDEKKDKLSKKERERISNANKVRKQFIKKLKLELKLAEKREKRAKVLQELEEKKRLKAEKKAAQSIKNSDSKVLNKETQNNANEKKLTHHQNDNETLILGADKKKKMQIKDVKNNGKERAKISKKKKSLAKKKTDDETTPKRNLKSDKTNNTKNSTIESKAELRKVKAKNLQDEQKQTNITINSANMNEHQDSSQQQQSLRESRHVNKAKRNERRQIEMSATDKQTTDGQARERSKSKQEHDKHRQPSTSTTIAIPRTILSQSSGVKNSQLINDINLDHTIHSTNKVETKIHLSDKQASTLREAKKIIKHKSSERKRSRQIPQVDDNDKLLTIPKSYL